MPDGLAVLLEHLKLDHLPSPVTNSSVTRLSLSLAAIVLHGIFLPFRESLPSPPALKVIREQWSTICLWIDVLTACCVLDISIFGETLRTEALAAINDAFNLITRVPALRTAETVEATFILWLHMVEDEDMHGVVSSYATLAFDIKRAAALISDVFTQDEPDKGVEAAARQLVEYDIPRYVKASLRHLYRDAVYRKSSHARDSHYIKTASITIQHINNLCYIRTFGASLPFDRTITLVMKTWVAVTSDLSRLVGETVPLAVINACALHIRLSARCRPVEAYVSTTVGESRTQHAIRHGLLRCLLQSCAWSKMAIHLDNDLCTVINEHIIPYLVDSAVLRAAAAAMDRLTARSSTSSLGPSKVLEPSWRTLKDTIYEWRQYLPPKVGRHCYRVNVGFLGQFRLII